MGFQPRVRFLFSAKKDGGSDAALPEAPPRPEGSRRFAEGHNDFALALYRQLLQGRGNLFFSPFSIRTALAMAYAGARGETALQMSRALRFAPDETLHAAFAKVIRRISSVGGGKCEISVANSLWVQGGMPLLTGFLELAARHYGGSVNMVDFSCDTEAARTRINRWVEDKTKQRIRELIPEGGLDALTRLVLANAVYFKGMWVLPFRKAATRDEPFYLEGGREANAPLMRRLAKVRYIQAHGYQAVEQNYQDSDLSMLVLLPDKRDGLSDLEAGLSMRMLRNCAADMLVREVDLFLPKFRLTWNAEMGDRLRKLGMPIAFVRLEADFSGINGREPPHKEALFISKVVHEAFVEVNEEGTEAAAATAVIMMETSAMPPDPTPIPVFRADHPFLFVIRDRKSGVILFLGRLADPTREG